ncbi:hypothetical protein M8818_006723 [Zalaria obscura]|uniref:Uncharacterized protein n=1 Tax=Zalaria obscura TaxID=2024903 RepID=A0ACC3S5D9_9PEZI
MFGFTMEYLLEVVAGTAPIPIASNEGTPLLASSQSPHQRSNGADADSRLVTSQYRAICAVPVPQLSYGYLCDIENERLKSKNGQAPTVTSDPVQTDFTTESDEQESDAQQPAICQRGEPRSKGDPFAYMGRTPAIPIVGSHHRCPEQPRRERPARFQRPQLVPKYRKPWQAMMHKPQVSRLGASDGTISPSAAPSSPSAVTPFHNRTSESHGTPLRSSPPESTWTAPSRRSLSPGYSFGLDHLLPSRVPIPRLSSPLDLRDVPLTSIEQSPTAQGAQRQRLPLLRTHTEDWVPPPSRPLSRTHRAFSPSVALPAMQPLGASQRTTPTLSRSPFNGPGHAHSASVISPGLAGPPGHMSRHSVFGLPGQPFGFSEQNAQPGLPAWSPNPQQFHMPGMPARGSPTMGQLKPDTLPAKPTSPLNQPPQISPSEEKKVEDATVEHRESGVPAVPLDSTAREPVQESDGSAVHKQVSSAEVSEAAPVFKETENLSSLGSGEQTREPSPQKYVPPFARSAHRTRSSLSALAKPFVFNAQHQEPAEETDQAGLQPRETFPAGPGDTVQARHAPCWA